MGAKRWWGGLGASSRASEERVLVECAALEVMVTVRLGSFIALSYKLEMACYS